MGYIRDLQHLLVDLLQGIDSLLELNVVRRKLGLAICQYMRLEPSSLQYRVKNITHPILSLSKLFLHILGRASGKGRE